MTIPSSSTSHLHSKGNSGITSIVCLLYDRHQHHHQQKAIRPAHQYPLAAIFKAREALDRMQWGARN